MRNSLTRTLRLEFEAPKKPKAKPRGDPSALIPYRYKKGRVVPPPPKRPKKPDFIAAAYRVELNKPAPPEIAEVLGLDGATWAEAIAFAMVRRAAGGDTTAAKEIREVTEGKLPSSVEVDAINYNLGSSPREVLLGKLLGRGADRE
jgi:hypothetical protein